MVNFPFTFSPVKEQLGLKCVFNQHNTEYNTHAEFFFSTDVPRRVIYFLKIQNYLRIFTFKRNKTKLEKYINKNLKVIPFTSFTSFSIILLIFGVCFQYILFKSIYRFTRSIFSKILIKLSDEIKIKLNF